MFKNRKPVITNLNGTLYTFDLKTMNRVLNMHVEKIYKNVSYQSEAQKTSVIVVDSGCSSNKSANYNKLNQIKPVNNNESLLNYR